MVENLYIEKKKLIYVVHGNQSVGLGHVYRAILLIQELERYNVTVLCLSDSALAVTVLEANIPNKIFLQSSDSTLLDSILLHNPEIVINDILNTDIKYMHNLKRMGIKTINFEDVGAGGKLADLLINAFSHGKSGYREKKGHQYFELRDEFKLLSLMPIKKTVKRILLSFGGTDPSNLSCRVIQFILPVILLHNISVILITGPGYGFVEQLTQLQEKINQDVKNKLLWISGGTNAMSYYIQQSDIAISAAGRSVLELAAVGLPTIIIASNQREATHNFPDVINRGYLCEQSKLNQKKLLKKLNHFLDYSFRNYMHEKLIGLDLKSGTKNIIGAIEECVSQAL